jgi:hypothetical protein
MNIKKIISNEAATGSNKRSLLFSKQKAAKYQSSNSPIVQRTCITPTDFKSQTMRLYTKEDSSHSKSQNQLTSLKFENESLTNENKKLSGENENLKEKIIGLCNSNKELVKTLVDVIQIFADFDPSTNFLKKKLLLEIKTTLVSKLEELSTFGINYKAQIEQVSL